MKKFLCAAAAIALSSAAFMPLRASAQVGVTLSVGNAPPPMRYEEIPPPRYGYVWVPGYWDWDGAQYVWHEGYWLPTRAGYFYEAPYWYQGPGGWHLRHGGWQHGRPGPHPGNGHGDWNHHGGSGRGDQDHDGIPNRVDRDRDGDGVSNRHDARPDNAHRR